MRTILIFLFLLSSLVLGKDSIPDPCLSFENQRKCEEAKAQKCKWLKAKEICKNEDILAKEIEEQKKGPHAIEDEVDYPVIHKKKKGKNTYYLLPITYSLNKGNFIK